MTALRIITFSFAAALVACSSSTSSSGSGSDDAGPSSSGGSSSGGGAGGSGGTPTDAGSVPKNDAEIVLSIPSTFKGTTRELDVVVTSTLPIAGPPAAILYQAESPVVIAGESLAIHGDATGVSGSYYVVVVLYMQGGGEFSPATGVDYEAQSTNTFSFSGGPINLGAVSLELAGADAGP